MQRPFLLDSNEPQNIKFNLIIFFNEISVIAQKINLIQPKQIFRQFRVSFMEKEKKKIVLRYYQIRRKLGEGAFGAIYLAINIKDNSQFALKIQNAQSKRSQLVLQNRTINELMKSRELQEQINIPTVYNFGKEGNSYIMVIDLLGPSLEQLFSLCDRRFSLKTTIIIGMEMLKLVRYVHSKGFLHRDIKPDNFLIGVKQNIHKIFMIDFGLAKKFLTKQNEHIPYKDNKDLTGTARYASINTHLGVEQGRRDDLQSLMYVLIYFLRGSLPWQNLKVQQKKEKYQKIMEKKLTFSIGYLTEDLPKQIQEMLAYVRCLHFTEAPDYDYLQQKMQNIAKRQNLNLQDKNFDWITVVKQKSSKKEQKRETE